MKYQIGDRYHPRSRLFSCGLKTLNDGTLLFSDVDVPGRIIRVEPANFTILEFLPWDSHGLGQAYRQAFVEFEWQMQIEGEGASSHGLP